MKISFLFPAKKKNPLKSNHHKSGIGEGEFVVIFENPEGGNFELKLKNSKNLQKGFFDFRLKVGD